MQGKPCRNSTPQCCTWQPHAGAAKLLASCIVTGLYVQALSTEANKQPTLAYEEIYADPAGHMRDRTSEASSSSRDGPLTAILLHGLLGSSRNWRTYTKNLVAAAAKEHGRYVI